MTEAIEQRLILAMMGELAGARVLDAACGDGALLRAAAARGAATPVDYDGETPEQRTARRQRNWTPVLGQIGPP